MWSDPQTIKPGWSECYHQFDPRRAGPVEYYTCIQCHICFVRQGQEDMVALREIWSPCTFLSAQEVS